ncbi:Protein arginine N-methyltransferase SFM1 [Pseudocercospora fuligena]|uniref:Protein arginine N-methyltransferase SFM1 n=1 Tax=Pseudocercospora fuligena TaxID=685502 RepID=A0A8H6R810_9PEZI|nr:Protein arginine N-methyltransferase SFM1 [Pseudocercospora fuligena]
MSSTGQKRRYTFIVEHLDPELEDWQALEYNTISEESTASGYDFLLSGLTSSFDSFEKLRVPASSKTSQSVEALYATPEARQKICLLDPKADKDISPEDADLFDGFLFGGILGDDPPRDRTGDLRKLGFPGRRLGPEQMTTDTAVRTTRIVVQDGKELSEIDYIDRPDIDVPSQPNGDGKGPTESISMPFKYVKGPDGKPIMPKGMHELLASDADKDIMDLL